MKPLCAVLAAAALVGCSAERIVASSSPRVAAPAERVAIKSGSPLYVLDGKWIMRSVADTVGLPAEVQQLKPEDVSQIEVIKGDAARQRYGSAGESGVVLITTKRRD
jgi:hypothetical protein